MVSASTRGPLGAQTGGGAQSVRHEDSQSEGHGTHSLRLCGDGSTSARTPGRELLPRCPDVLEGTAGMRENWLSQSSRADGLQEPDPGPGRSQTFWRDLSFAGEKPVPGYGFLSVESVPHVPAVC